MMTKTRRPRGCADMELRKVGVEIICPDEKVLKCQKCGVVWSPNIRPGGRLPRGWWQCPNGCNTEDTE
jgi:hypothetical protein